MKKTEWEEALTAPEVQVTNFWCRKCGTQFIREGHKGLIESYKFAFYEARCLKCRERVRRHLTDRRSDPYWHSPAVERERREYADDILQPGDARFRTVYGKTDQERKAEERMERSEREKWMRRTEGGVQKRTH